MEICLAYVLKYNSNHEKQITFLIIPYEKDSRAEIMVNHPT